MREENKMARWALGMAGKYALVILAFIAYTLLIARGAEAKAERRYESWKEGWIADYVAEREAEARAAYDADPYTIQLNAEAELLARVLYGVKDNSTDDLKTYCWCVFNRVDSKDYPDTLEEVIAQPKQWMRYDPENPVLESLYQIARQQLDEWHSNSRRPVSSEYVFMNWTEKDICLRDNFSEGGVTRYWRYGQ